MAEALTALEDRFLESAYAAAAPVLRPWFGEARLRETLRREIVRDLAATTPGRPPAPADGSPARLIELPGGHAAVVAFRARMKNRDRPHGLVLQQTFDPADHAALASLRDRVRSLHWPAPLRGLAMYQHGEPAADLGGAMGGATGEAFTHYVAARMDELHPPPGARAPAGLRVEPATTLAFFETYRAWYEAFWRARPDLEPLVPVETRESFRLPLEHDGLRLIYLDEALCGVYAAERRLERGLVGWRMKEKVIAPQFRGRGLSAPAFLRFARSLRHEQHGADGAHGAIWGTIVPENRPSLASAIATGRRIVGGLRWIGM